jgi:hypothetical protein
MAWKVGTEVSILRGPFVVRVRPWSGQGDVLL